MYQFDRRHVRKRIAQFREAVTQHFLETTLPAAVVHDLTDARDVSANEDLRRLRTGERDPEHARRAADALWYATDDAVSYFLPAFMNASLCDEFDYDRDLYSLVCSGLREQESMPGRPVVKRRYLCGVRKSTWLLLLEWIAIVSEIARLDDQGEDSVEIDAFRVEVLYDLYRMTLAE